jgi:hypothetical protein
MNDIETDCCEAILAIAFAIYGRPFIPIAFAMSTPALYQLCSSLFFCGTLFSVSELDFIDVEFDTCIAQCTTRIVGTCKLRLPAARTILVGRGRVTILFHRRLL